MPKKIVKFSDDSQIVHFDDTRSVANLREDLNSLEEDEYFDALETIPEDGNSDTLEEREIFYDAFSNLEVYNSNEQSPRPVTASESTIKRVIELSASISASEKRYANERQTRLLKRMLSTARLYAPSENSTTKSRFININELSFSSLLNYLKTPITEYLLLLAQSRGRVFANSKHLEFILEIEFTKVVSRARFIKPDEHIRQMQNLLLKLEKEVMRIKAKESKDCDTSSVHLLNGNKDPSKTIENYILFYGFAHEFTEQEVNQLQLQFKDILCSTSCVGYSDLEKSDIQRVIDVTAQADCALREKFESRNKHTTITHTPKKKLSSQPKQKHATRSTFFTEFAKLFSCTSNSFDIENPDEIIIDTSKPPSSHFKLTHFPENIGRFVKYIVSSLIR